MGVVVGCLDLRVLEDVDVGQVVVGGLVDIEDSDGGLVPVLSEFLINLIPQTFQLGLDLSRTSPICWQLVVDLDQENWIRNI